MPTPVLLALLACVSPAEREPRVRRAAAGDTATRDDTARGASGDTSGTDTARDTALADTAPDTDGAACPPEMALAGTACVDRWEAHLAGWSPYEVPSEGVAVSAAGEVPQGYISGDVAALACAAAGKRLCTSEEWLRACGGPGGRRFPYGDSYDPAACNDDYAGSHPVIDYFGTSTGIWDAAHMNDPGINQEPGTVDAAGANLGCVSAEGIHDLHGNLHEWVDDADGTFRGGFYADAATNGEGCAYATTAHTRDYHDYSTGFRCCRDPEPAARPASLHRPAGARPAARPAPAPPRGAAAPSRPAR